MRVRLWFSIFLEDAHGTAFGAASGFIEVVQRPTAGQRMSGFGLPSSSPPLNEKSESQVAIETLLRGLRVESCTLDEDSGNHSCEMEDVVVVDQDFAVLFVEYLTLIGFDCDVW